MNAFRDVTKGPGDLPGDSSHPNSPDFDASRDEWIDARATDLTDARMADHGKLTEAVDQILGFSDWTASIGSDMAAVLGASEAAFEAEAVQFFARLEKRVKQDIRDEAESEAEVERDRWESEQDEIRDGSGLADAA